MTQVPIQKNQKNVGDGFKELGLQLNDIDQIILTHHDLDHCDGLDFFDKSVPVYGHKDNQRWLKITDEFLDSHNQFLSRFF